MIFDNLEKMSVIQLLLTQIIPQQPRPHFHPTPLFSSSVYIKKMYLNFLHIDLRSGNHDADQRLIISTRP